MGGGHKVSKYSLGRFEMFVCGDDLKMQIPSRKKGLNSTSFKSTETFSYYFNNFGSRLRHSRHNLRAPLRGSNEVFKFFR